jgi:short-subunit dehydrogenase
MRLPECRAVLTGASGGIGLALAERLCAGGAQVIAVARQEVALEPLRQRYAEQVRVVTADLASPGGRQAVVDAAHALGGVNLAINAAGINRLALLEQMDDQAVAEMLDINLVATVQLTRALLPLLRQQQALLVNIGSIYGSIGYPGYATYCASKFALRGFSEALRREMADTGVGVLYVAPRATSTPMNSDRAVALNRALKVTMDTPESVADAVIRAIELDRSELYLGWPEKFFVRLNGMLPRLVDRALRKQLPLIRQFTHKEMHS